MPKKIKNSSDIEQHASSAAISYIWIFSLYILLTKPHSAFVQFHARQASLLFGVEVLAPLLGPFGVVIILVAIFFAVKGFRAASQGQYWTMPILGSWLQKHS